MGVRQLGNRCFGPWTRVAALWGLALPVLAQDAPLPTPASPAAPALVATRMPAGHRLHMTGGLDDPAWQQAPVVDTFWQVKPVDGRPAPVRTAVRVLFDDQALYFGVEAFDPAIQALRAQLVRRDTIKEDQDYIGVFIDPIGAGKSAMFVRVNAAGVLADGLYSADTNRLDFSPDFEVDAMTRQGDKGYTVEMRVPFSALRFDASQAPAWQLQVVRSYPRDALYKFTSVPLSMSAGSAIERMNRLQELEVSGRETRWSIRPTLTARTERVRQADGRTAHETEFEAGLDANWYPGGNWMLDGTLNPDFSQVELDVPQLSSNVQFPLQLQEKRPFFLESSDILEATSLMSEQGGGGLQAIYTRSITQPRWGMRATYRSDSQEAVMLSTRDEGGALALVPGTYEAGVVAQPGSSIQLGRYRMHHGDLSAGLIAIDRRYEDDIGSNSVLGADLVWRSSAGDRVRGIAMHSWTSAWAGEDGQLHRGQERRGSYALVDWIRNSDTLEPSLTLQQASSHYRNDTGFTAQSGFRQATAQLQYKNQFEGAWSEVNPYIFYVGSQDLHGNTIVHQPAPGIWAHGPYDMQVLVEVQPHRLQRVREGGRLHELSQTYVEFRASPAAWFGQFAAEWTSGDMVDVAADAKRTGSSWLIEGHFRFAHRIELEARTEWTALRSRGERVLFDKADSVVLIYHFGPRDALRTIVQRHDTERASPTAGQPALKDTSLDLSLTYSHRLSAASIFYLGASSHRADFYDGMRERAKELFAKWQFEF